MLLMMNRYDVSRWIDQYQQILGAHVSHFQNLCPILLDFKGGVIHNTQQKELELALALPLGPDSHDPRLEICPTRFV